MAWRSAHAARGYPLQFTVVAGRAATRRVQGRDARHAGNAHPLQHRPRTAPGVPSHPALGPTASARKGFRGRGFDGAIDAEEAWAQPTSVGHGILLM